MEIEACLELFDKESLTDEEIEQCFRVLAIDSTTDQKLIDSVFKFYLILMDKWNQEYSSELHVIVNNYIVKNNDINNKQEELYFIEMNYMFEIGAFGRSLYYAHKIIDLNDAPLSFKYACITYIIAILFREDMISECFSYLDVLDNILGDKRPKAETDILFSINRCDIYAKAGKLDLLEETLDYIREKLKTIENSEELLPLQTSFELHIIYQNLLLNEYNEEELKAFASKFDVLFSSVTTVKSFSEEYSTVIIPILSKLRNVISIETIIGYVRRVLQLNSTLFEKLSFYSFLIDDLSISYDDYFDLYMDYTNSLKDSYRLQRGNATADIASEISIYALKKEYSRLKETYDIDPLTGCYNRIMLNRWVHECVVPTTAIVYFDIDYLKTVNDQYGHYIGDQYIKAFTTTLLDVFKDVGIAIRYGGDEFVVIVQKTTRESLENLLVKFDSKIQKINKIEEYDINIMYSCGVVMGDNVMSVSDAIRHADSAMYSIKHQAQPFKFYN